MPSPRRPSPCRAGVRRGQAAWPRPARERESRSRAGGRTVIAPASRTGYGWRPAGAWWAVTGSNRRPLGCKPSALPTELTARACTVPARRRLCMWAGASPAGRAAPVEGAAPAGGSGDQLLTASLRDLPALNFGCLEAGIEMASPVRGFASARGLAVRDAERTESRQPDIGAAAKRIRDGVEHAVHRARGIGVGDAGAACNSLDELSLVHCSPPFRSRCKDYERVRVATRRGKCEHADAHRQRSRHCHRGVTTGSSWLHDAPGTEDARCASRRLGA